MKNRQRESLRSKSYLQFKLGLSLVIFGIIFLIIPSSIQTISFGVFNQGYLRILIGITSIVLGAVYFFKANTTKKEEAGILDSNAMR